MMVMIFPNQSLEANVSAIRHNARPEAVNSPTQWSGRIQKSGPRQAVNILPSLDCYLHCSLHEQHLHD